jgi:hypothetical protein
MHIGTGLSRTAATAYAQMQMVNHLAIKNEAAYSQTITLHTVTIQVYFTECPKLISNYCGATIAVNMSYIYYIHLVWLSTI